MHEDLEHVFGRGRRKMATGDHVEVFREAAAPGERRRYTKRFLATGSADFRRWTDREWRILARLIGHGVRCVPAVARYHGGAEGALSELQTYDAGISVDQWATLVPVARDGATRRHVFEDAAHWWALAHHCLAALDEIHALELVHLDVKADNLCIPYAPASFDPADPDATVVVDFPRLALIDFAFSLVSRERLATSLPLGWQKDYDYQSPRLLRALEAGRDGDLVPTQELDWRCDLYGLAAMLRRYLPDDSAGWTIAQRDDARALVYALREAHDRDDATRRPHRDLLVVSGAHVHDAEAVRSIAAGWTLVRDRLPAADDAPGTPMTRIAAPVGRTSLTDIRTTIVAPAREFPTVFRNPRSLDAIVTPVAWTPPPPTARKRIGGAVLVAASAGLAALAFVGSVDGPRVEPRAAVERVASRSEPVAAPELAVPSVVPPSVAAELPAEPRATSRAPAPPKVASVTPAPAERARPRVVTAPPPAASPWISEKALALLQGPSAARAPSAPYDAAAAQRATARLAAQAMRASPGLPHAPPAPVVAVEASPQLPPVAAPPPAPVVVAQAEPVAPAIVRAPEPVKLEPPKLEAPRPEPPKPEKHDRFRDRVQSALALLGLTPQRAAPVEERASRPPPEPDVELATRGRRFVSEMVPVVAAQASADLAGPLDLAATRGPSAGSRTHADAANARWRAETIVAATPSDARRARELYEAAREAYAAGRTTEAVEQDLKAFAANPRDPDVAGFLAFLHLRTKPLRAETARQLALHALAFGGPQRGARFEDWNTYAIASALTGRQGDASRAYQLMAALADPDRSCRAALRAQAQFGDALRVPVEALSARLRRDGRVDEAPACSGSLARMASAPG